jgi:NAD+ synthase (glutamine-hydrolysing)
MNRIHVGAAALNLTPKDWSGNVRILLAAIAEAKERGVAVLCLPELCLTGYGCEDEFHAPYVAETARELLLTQLLPASKGIIVSVGLPFNLDGCVYNGIAHLADGVLLGIVAKRNLAGDGIHYEPRFFKAWQQGYSREIAWGDHCFAVGDLIFDHGGIRIGYEVCEDAWVAERPGIALSRQNVDLILNPSASHFAFGKSAIRERFVREGSRAFHCGYVYANLLGNEAGRAIYDGDCLIANHGEIMARGGRFHYGDWSLVHAIIDLDAGRVQRHRQASYRPQLDGAIRVCEGNWTPPKLTQKSADALEDMPRMPKEQEFAEAVALGLYDYLRKARASGFALSLSGGADSAACLALIHWLARRIVQASPDNLPPALDAFLQQLPTDAADSERARALTGKLCVCAYQASANSGEATLHAARSIAEACGARFLQIDIQPLVDAYENILEGFLERPLTWQDDDLARQNIQARVRAPGIWAIANAANALLLATSNRSEAAVGYCTMDGDTAGSISPIAGIDKAFLRDWLRWAEVECLPALKAVNALAPTAELRPPSSGQTDEADLMPYPILNRIQKLAVVRKASPRSIYFTLRNELDDTISDRQIFDWLKRYLQLWSRNQWKRERYAPSFHLDDENLDPRSWCRYPILSGGYADEMKQLEEALFTDSADV